MQTAMIHSARTLALARTTAVSLLIVGLCACDPAARQASTIAVASTASAKPAAAAASTFDADDALAIAVAHDQAVRAAREQTLRVQRQLVEQRRATRDASQHGNANERCIAGQRMRRVANGWVQAGAC